MNECALYLKRNNICETKYDDQSLIKYIKTAYMYESNNRLRNIISLTSLAEIISNIKSK